MSQNLQNVARFPKFQLDNLVDFEKCCKTRIFLQKSVPIQPKTRNILPKICQKLATTLRADAAGTLRSACIGAPGTLVSSPAVLGRTVGPGAATATVPTRVRGLRLAKLAKLANFTRYIAYFCKFLAGSFSAVSKRNFARKYAFDSIFQALQDLHTFAPLQSQNFSKKIGLKNQQFL